MAGREAGFWDLEHRVRELSERGDPLEKFGATVDFEIFRSDLKELFDQRGSVKGGRPGFDAVLKFWIPVLQALICWRWIRPSNWWLTG